MNDAFQFMADFSRAETPRHSGCSGITGWTSGCSGRPADRARRTLERAVSVRKDISTAQARCEAVAKEKDPSLSMWNEPEWMNSDDTSDILSEIETSQGRMCKARGAVPIFIYMRTCEPTLLYSGIRIPVFHTILYSIQYQYSMEYYIL
jgi:hypothetical protein